MMLYQNKQDCFDSGKAGAYHNGVLLKDTPLVSNIRLGWKALPEINTILIASVTKKKVYSIDAMRHCDKTFLSLIVLAKLFLLASIFRPGAYPSG